MLKRVAVLGILLVSTCPFFGQATVGYHRMDQVLQRAPQGGIAAQVVPYATIYVTYTATGLAATIYSDPLLTAPIPNSTVTTDENGNYGYYLPSGQCVTETIMYPEGGSTTNSNICYGTGTVGSIVAGTGIGISPAGGTGVVTISNTGLTSLNTMTGPAVSIVGDSTISVTANSPGSNQLQLHATGAGGSGVQYNPSTTTYIFTGSSAVGDDTRVLGASYASSAWSCNGTTCTVTTSSTLPAVNDWIDVGSLSGGSFSFVSGTTYGPYNTGINVFRVASLGTGTFTFNYTANTGSCSTGCGTAYNANYWLFNQVQGEPFFNGHGTTMNRMPTVTPLLANIASNFANLFAGIPNGTTGAPVYLFIVEPTNDLTAGTSCSSVSQMEGYYQTIFADAHAKGWLVYPTLLWPPTGSSGCAGNAQLEAQLLNWWLIGQLKNPSNTASAQFEDGLVDANGLMWPTGVNVAGAGGFTYAGVTNVARAFNLALATQGSYLSAFSRNIFGGGPSGFGMIVMPQTDTQQAFSVWRNSSGVSELSVDTTTDIVRATQLQVIGLSGSAGNSNSFYINLPSSYNGGNNSEYYHTEQMSGLAGGWPTTNTSRMMKTYGVNFGAGYQGDYYTEEFDYAGHNSTLNEYQLSFGGATNPFIRAFFSGELDFPSAAPASGGPDCLQIAATTGAISNTGSPCVLPILSGTTASIGGSALTAGSCASGTVTITGATTSMVVTATPVTYPGAGFDWNRSYVSAANTVTVQVCADVAGTPTASAYNVRVIQ